jgi:3-hydroxybutyryl-CoA dehydrogenase
MSKGVKQSNTTIVNILRNQGKRDLMNSVDKGVISLEDAVMQETYPLSNMDYWVLAESLRLPIILFTSMKKIKHIMDGISWLKLGENSASKYLFFVRAPTESDLPKNAIYPYTMITPGLMWTEVPEFQKKYLAAVENMDIKKSIFKELDALCQPETILATNTSSLSITEVATATSRPDKVIGMHFFNPAPVQKFVEVISTQQSHEDIVEAVTDLARSIGKSPATVGDKPGFIVNKLLLTYLNHAVRLLDDDVASRETIDSAMRELAHFPMGPLELLDLIGLDTSVEVLNTIFADTGDSLDAPATGLTSLIAEGHKGRKTGAGFYDYSEKHEAPVSSEEELKIQVHNTLMRAYLQTARDMNDSGYASQADIDMGMKLGCGLPEGPFETLDHFVA